MKGSRQIIRLLLMLVLSACSGYSYHSSVPSAPVQYTINVLVEDPTFVPSNTGAYKIIDRRRYETDFIGYAGLLIYIGMDMNYYAFDLACPHCLNRTKHLQVDGMFAVCEICKEEYDISYGYGTPTKGVTNEPLCPYHCTWNGTTLTIIN